MFVLVFDIVVFSGFNCCFGVIVLLVVMLDFAVSWTCDLCLFATIIVWWMFAWVDLFWFVLWICLMLFSLLDAVAAWFTIVVCFGFVVSDFV